MTSCYPALRGKFGSTEYFLTTMPVSELVSRVKFPVEMPEWDDGSIEERYQRKLDMRRIKKELAPYFSEDPHRFSGSLVLAVLNHSEMGFEHMSKITGDLKNIPNLYRNAAAEMGFVIMQGQEMLVPLDGQHRVKAFKIAIEGDAADGVTPPAARPNIDLARDAAAVILVRFNKTASRYIFNKINRYAKPTGKADKLITDDDDAVAVITRRLVAGGVIPQRLVNIDTNTLSEKAREFTTLATFYDANKKLLSALPVPSTIPPEKLKPLERDSCMEELRDEWKRLLSGIGQWKRATADLSEGGDAARVELRKTSVLGRPLGQASLINGYALACKKDRHADRDGLVKKLDGMDWSMGAALWKGLLVKPNGKIMAGKSASNSAGTMIAHMIGAKLTRKESDGVMKFVHGNASEGHHLPEPIGLG